MDDMELANGEGRLQPNPERNRRASSLETDPDSMKSETNTKHDDPHHEFWGDSADIERVVLAIHPPIKPLAILEKLGPSPFERGSFPLIGFLATTFDKVSHFALERAGYQPEPDTTLTTDIHKP